MNYPDPWPTTEAEVRHWQITSPYNFFERRASVIEALFAEDTYSIDGIVLGSVALSSLAEWRYGGEIAPRKNAHQQRFRALLTDHCDSFDNRVSIPEVLRLVKSDAQFKAFDSPIRERYQIAGILQMRRSEEDPLVADFSTWASAQSPAIPVELLYRDYAGCMFSLYRNSVLHELRVAKDREARYTGLDDPSVRPIFYANHSAASSNTFVRDLDPVDYMRFGVHPPYLLDLLREAISSLRQWAVAHNRDLFE